MGPIEHYANPKCITGRAGLRPSRYQSDQVDNADGSLVRNCNRSLRAAILGIADNPILCNHHFQTISVHQARAGRRSFSTGRTALCPLRLNKITPDGHTGARGAMRSVVSSTLHGRSDSFAAPG